jgi:hypothetical protein
VTSVSSGIVINSFQECENRVVARRPVNHLL